MQGQKSKRYRWTLAAIEMLQMLVDPRRWRPENESYEINSIFYRLYKWKCGKAFLLKIGVPRNDGMQTNTIDDARDASFGIILWSRRFEDQLMFGGQAP